LHRFKKFSSEILLPNGRFFYTHHIKSLLLTI